MIPPCCVGIIIPQPGMALLFVRLESSSTLVAALLRYQGHSIYSRRHLICNTSKMLANWKKLDK